MRILLDESLPRQLASDLAAFDVSTVRQQRWIGLRNGVLLRAAADAGFDVLLTADRSMQYQQNLREIGIALLVITGVRHRIEDLRSLIPQIASALALIKPGDSFEIMPARRDSVFDRAESLLPHVHRHRERDHAAAFSDNPR